MRLNFLPLPALAATLAVPVALPVFAQDEILTFAIENDKFGGGTDSFYTNGVRLSYLNAKSTPPLWADRLIRALPMIDEGPLTSYNLSLGQNMYTPEDITLSGPQYGDRPYAGYTYVSMAVASGNLQRVDDVELSLGVVGPASLAEETQDYVHRILSIERPQGWTHQLDNEPALNIAWQRRYPRYLELGVGPTLFSFEPYVTTALGNVYTHAGVGGTLRWSTDGLFIGDNPVRVRPAMPGNGYFDRANYPVLTLFAGAEERLVARNIFLDGNTFTGSDNVRKRNFVTDINVGATLSFSDYQLGYTMVHRSKEFFGQDDAQIFGALTFGVRF